MGLKGRHKDKDIQAAIEYALANGWTLEKRNGHAWGVLKCPHGARGGCNPSVWSTPANPAKFARHLRHCVDTCPHQGA